MSQGRKKNVARPGLEPRASRLSCEHSTTELPSHSIDRLHSHGFIYVDRNATAVNKLQVSIKYTFDLEVRNVRGQIASIFFQGVHMFQPRYFYS